MISSSSRFLAPISLLVQIFLFFSSIPNFIVASTTLEWILLKYEIPPETLSPNDSLQFRLYSCSNFLNLANPALNKCKGGIASLQGKPLPKKIFSSICLIKPEENGKCAFIKIQLNSPAEANFIYIRVQHGHLALTNPEYQQLMLNNGGRKNILRLGTAEAGKFISIAYSIQLPIGSLEKGLNSNALGPVKTTVISPLERKRLKSNKNQKTSKIGAAPIQQLLESPPPLSSTISPPICQLIAQMGKNELQIRQFLMADAARQRINPMQFDVEHYKKAVIKIHNRYRKLHGSGDLSHDWECENSAKSWAESVARKADCLSHEPQKRFGESLFFYSTLEPELTDPDTLAEATVRTFYVEGSNYRQSGSPNWNAVRHGHFTQMLWRQTRRIGVGVSVLTQPAGWGQCMPTGRRQQKAWLFYVVLRYDPPGNIRWGPGSFDGNVTVELERGKDQNCLAF